MIERRQTARRRVCLGGFARVAAFLPEIACTLRDVSLGGVRIRVDPSATLPDRFDLVVPCRGQTRRVRVVWRDGDAAGLGFDDAPSEGAPHDLLRRLAESEAEVARLRSALKPDSHDRPDRLH